MRNYEENYSVRLEAIKESVIKLTETVQNHINNCAENSSRILRIVEKHEVDIHGNGKIGMRREIDALNRDSFDNEKRRSRQLAAVFTVLTGLVGKIIYDFIRR